MLRRDLIVPYRKHTLLECDYIIRQFVNPQEFTYAAPATETEAEKWRGWIDACMDNPSHDLNSWEASFIISVSDDLTHKGKLTEKQVEVLERIYTEKA